MNRDEGVDEGNRSARTRGGVWVEWAKIAREKKTDGGRNLHKGCTGLEQLPVPGSLDSRLRVAR